MGMWATLILLCCPLVFGACGSGNEAPFFPPDEAGPHAAGLMTGAAAGPDDLSLPVYAWYPTAGRERDAAYGELGDIRGSYSLEAPGLCDEPRPVAIFSHGNGGMAYQTFSLAEHLARHGWVVAACDHVFNTMLDGGEGAWAGVLMRRPLDVAATFDWVLQQADSGESPITGCVDPAAGYAVIGHSFGGYTALATSGNPIHMQALEAQCEGDDGTGCTAVRQWTSQHPGEALLDRSDPRIWAAVALAPAYPDIYGQRDEPWAMPTLVVGGEIDDNTTWDDDVDPIFRKLAHQPRFLAGLTGAGHYSFTDFCPLLGESFNGCGPEARPVNEVMALVRTLTLAFLLEVRGHEQARDWLPPGEGTFHWESVDAP